MCAVLWAASVQEDEGVPLGYADMPEHGGHLGLLEHLDLEVTVADLVGLGGIRAQFFTRTPNPSNAIRVRFVRYRNVPLLKFILQNSKSF